MSSECLCHSGLEYSACCGPFLAGSAVAQTPEQLMRSRYCAFVLKNADYLINTWHPDCHAEQLRHDLLAGFEQTEWLGLTIFATQKGNHDNEGFVSFVARYRDKQHDSAIIERSRFLNQNGQWYYIDGMRPEFGRNDPCPCGSGKKFKKCCGR
ncbi:YchJ family protein [Mangrovibacter plantisponsor]|uniref:UPF0225 protein DES37_10362 n=1 Tax=Mangrovibacter plantisponsor TaxID=451513 RepID=A0A317Q469_9ENTR|nr:YchJ family protein [Mangrovibacter plantisponsor]PWW10687.1 SEC-C motif-containing protein [Mangrovibacter plantisponsor]